MCIRDRLLAAEAAVGAAALLVVELFPRQLIGIFGAANESVYYTAFAVKSFRIYLCMMVLATVNKGTFIFLQSLGKAVESTVISLTREIVFGVALPILFPLFWGLDGLLYSCLLYTSAVLDEYLVGVTHGRSPSLVFGL